MLVLRLLWAEHWRVKAGDERAGKMYQASGDVVAVPWFPGLADPALLVTRRWR